MKETQKYIAHPKMIRSGLVQKDITLNDEKLI
jgi:hypothetical protein